MDAPYYNGEPGAMPYDEQERTCATRQPQPFTCSDCGTAGLTGYCAVSVTNKVFCQDCKQRRGLAYLFDIRPWESIAKALQRRSA